MLGGAVVMLLFVFATGNVNVTLFEMTIRDFWYLILLASVCTSFAFLISVWVMKKLSPFTVSMSVNMEPIYTILIVVVYGIFAGIQTELMSWGFYLGSAIIIASIFANAVVKRKQRKKVKLVA